MDQPAEQAADRTEAIVIGSGFGGAVAACRLAQAGFAVLILERGRRFEKDDFPALPTAPALLPDLRRWVWQTDQGLWDLQDLEEITSVQAAGYGGGSLIYANVHLRPPAAIFERGWPKIYRDPATLAPFFDLAGYMLDVAPVTASPHYPNLVKTEQLRRAAAATQGAAAFFHPPLAINYVKEGENEHGRPQGACTHCGRCCTGCPVGAKNTLDLNYLALAERHGARALTQCEVTRIVQNADGSWTVWFFDHLHARNEQRTAPHVFLCAGTVHSTRLLAGAELRGHGRGAKARVGLGYYPNADAIGVAFQTTHPQYPSWGPAITGAVVHHGPKALLQHASDDDHYFLIQDGGYAPELARLIGLLRAPIFLGRNRLTRAGDAPLRGSAFVPPKPSLLGSLPASHRLSSPLDALLDASAGGDLNRLVSQQTALNWRRFLQQLETPLALRAIVEHTIDLALRARLRQWWWTRWAAPDGLWQRLWLGGLKAALRWGSGDVEHLAAFALQSALSAGASNRYDRARDLLGYDDQGADHRMMLLAMGRDTSSGVLLYDRDRDRLIADLDLYGLAPLYQKEELLMADLTKQLGGELRVSPTWSFLGKPVTVHSQGGCRMADEPRHGVTDANGNVHGCPGLHVLDGSILSRSVGVNPSATILAIAERNVLEFIRSTKRQPAWPAGDTSPGAVEYAEQTRRAGAWAARAAEAGWQLTPPDVPPRPIASQPLVLSFQERMEGAYWPDVADPGQRPAPYREYERQGREDYPLRLQLTAKVDDLARFFEDAHHRLDLTGTAFIRLPGETTATLHPVVGQLQLFAERHKPYGLRRRAARRAQQEITGRAYRTRVGRVQRAGGASAGAESRMEYQLSISDRPGWSLSGFKLIRDDPGLDAWRDTSSLFVRLSGPAPDGARSAQQRLRGAGTVHVDLDGFLTEQLPSIRVETDGGQSPDPARATWAILCFASFFFGQLQRVYLPEVESALRSLFEPRPANVRFRPPSRSGWR